MEEMTELPSFHHWHIICENGVEHEGEVQEGIKRSMLPLTYF